MTAYYTCPICDQRIERELLTFLKHGDFHIIDEIKKAHPNWVCSAGLCPKCLEYYEKRTGRKLPSQIDYTDEKQSML